MKAVARVPITCLVLLATGAFAMERVRISDDGKSFVLAGSGAKFVPWGVNYDHDDAGRLIEDYWTEEWGSVAEDFREIKALGANVVRIHPQLGKFMSGRNEANAAELAQLGKVIRLCEELGLYLDVTGLGCYHAEETPAWYDSLPEADRWEVQATFWTAIARTCAGSPAVFCYDLMNEPVFAGKSGDNEWVTGKLGGKSFVQRLTLDMAGRTREDVAKAWINQLVDAIRKEDAQTLITVGVIPWALSFPGAKPTFYAPEVCQRLDFASVHFYPQKGEMDKALKALALYDVGKPLVIEEMFPMKCSLDEMEEFILRSREHADGWISFYWGITRDEYRRIGGIKGAIMGGWLERFEALGKKVSEGD